MWPSLEIWAAPPGANGLTTATTCGIRCTFASSGAIWARTLRAVAEPCELCHTIVSVSPLWAGNSLFSRSTTCWDSVPGRLKSVA